MKTARKFTKSDPCTKVEIHNCFMGVSDYQARPVVDAKMEIGDNAPKYLVRKGYAVERLMGGVDYYELTTEGEEWLTEGLKRYLVLHPERAADVRQAKRATIIRRGAGKPLESPTMRRVIRRGGK